MSVAPPRRRADHLVMSRINDEILIFDQLHGVMHTLNPATATIWHALDGTTPVASLALRYPEIGVSGVEEAVRLLSEANLLEGAVSLPPAGSSRSRRRLLKQGGIAAAVTLPTLFSVTPHVGASPVTCNEDADEFPSFQECYNFVLDEGLEESCGCPLVGSCYVPVCGPPPDVCNETDRFQDRVDCEAYATSIGWCGCERPVGNACWTPEQC